MKTTKLVFFIIGILMCAISFGGMFALITDDKLQYPVNSTDITIQIEMWRRSKIEYSAQAILISGVLLVGFFKDWDKEEPKN